MGHALEHMRLFEFQKTTTPILYNEFCLEDTLVQMLARLDSIGESFEMPPLSPLLNRDARKIYHRPLPVLFSDYSSAQQT
jgi:hypothetical protein